MAFHQELLSVGAFLLALPVLVILYAFYNAFLHPLRHYPGPLLWRCFRFPYVIATQKGQVHNRLRDFHTRYGPVVRCAPDELSYADAGAWKDIYSNRPGHAPFPRNSTWFKKIRKDEPPSIMGFDEDAHARYRRAFANSFSAKSLKEQVPVLESYVDMFMSQLKGSGSGRRWIEKTVDFTAWFNFLTFDISGDFTFGESFDCMKNGKPHPWVEISQDFGKGLTMIASVNNYPPIDKLLRYVVPKHIRERNMTHRDITMAKAMKRLAVETDRPDWVTPTRKHAGEKSAMTDAEWGINLLVLGFAASETTASALTAILRELCQNRGVLHRLTQEIRDSFSEEADINIASTTDLTYLNAVINEGLRFAPPVVISVPRTVPKGGDTICGQWVPEGTYVAYNQYPSNRQPFNFHSPNSFIPERFLNPTPETDNMSTLQPFHIGRHSCLGIKIAYMEMRLTLTRLLWSFDVALADPKDRWDWGDQNMYMFWEKRPMNIILRHARHTT